MYLNLITELERNHITEKELAELWGVHRNTVSNKLNRKTPITIEEAILVRDRFFPYADFQYLFKKYQDANEPKAG